MEPGNDNQGADKPLEESNWQEVKHAAIESGYQMFFARVTEGELVVQTI